ncbi:MAG: hypothetical protein ABMB14_30495, partial [Myxococcota bacterium]
MFAIAVGFSVLLSCTGRGPAPEETAPGSTSGPAPIVFDEAAPEGSGLRVELYDAGAALAGASTGASAGAGADAVPTPPAAPLAGSAIDALLARVDALEPLDGDRATFAVRPGSKPPP